jgi:dienelactone hydrolase
MLAVAVLLSACRPANHYLVHPQQPAGGTVTWSEDIQRDQLLIHIEGAHPPGGGPFATVIVHPEGGHTAADMRGIIWDLAGQGYCAVAADYQRRIGGTYRRSLFAWRSVADATAIVDVITQHPEVDPERIAVLGYSQGGVYSLLIAAYAPDRIKAVVSYYPVTDFPHWLDQPQANPFRRSVFGIIRWFFKRESGAESEEQFQEMLRGASPYYVAESIRAPVLLIHGDRDTTAPVEQSERMAERLARDGHEVTLLVVPGGVHIFNFRQGEEAALAWEATLQWLTRHVPSTPAPSALRRLPGLRLLPPARGPL